MRLTIISANLGGYDAWPKQHVEQTVPVKWVNLTDVGVSQWLPPRLAAKVPKMFPGGFTDADTSVWIDGSFRVKSPHFAEMCLRVLERTDLAVFKHWGRDSIYTELVASERMPKYDGEPMREQVAAYKAAGHPKKWGLWECGVIVRRHTPQVKALMQQWWQEIEQWSVQDQLSFAHVCWRNDYRPTELFGTRMSQPWLEWEGHTRND